ncbi:hypothetical protein DMB66_11960 [Actinoplanes sp. ATCC 53533]|uniref:hypothetical protein n=1 Tax=Actinoplanes sp. ATCC 53533 TaxID=1288362 RepID=UPI000F78BC80|nr:hypothetical protein [Actinoplanes sp. ATCC 53533]RSM68988.1 hypothetical protein DMB66_11960 [Actinoplanes sp. ATCC 53533]
MAFRTWAKLLAATLGVGALAGASQLGLAYGLGIVRLTRVLDVTTRDQWTAQLAWVAWIPMLACVTGALAGATLLRRWAPGSPVPGVGTELALAFSAAVGAGLVVPLTMQPARTAQVAGVNEVVVIAICAGLGALVGVFAAWAALAQAIARWSLATMGAAVWVIALVSVAPSLAPSDPLPAIRLGVFDAGFLSPAVTQRTALATMPALALVIGALLGWAARRRELPILTVALAGLPGPALLTIAYLIAGPGAGDDRYQVVPYWAAMTATGAGVLGSVLAAVLRRGPGPDDEDDREDAGPEKPTLPQRADHPESALAATAGPSTSGTGGGPGGGGSIGAGDQPRPVDTDDFDLPQRNRSVDTPKPGYPASGRAGRADGHGRGDGPGAALSGPAGPGAGLGGPPPVAAKPEKPRRRGRRSSVADAFIGRTGEFPTTQPDDSTAEFPATRPGGDLPGPRHADSTDEFPPGRPRSGEPAPYDAFARGNPGEASRSGGGAPWSPAADPHYPGGRTEPSPYASAPYVPEPATRPLPPGVGTSAPEPGQPRGTGGRLGRSLRPFSRGKVTEPLTPEPTAISAPLPHPDPVTPPLAVTPAPRADAAPNPVGETPDGKRKPKGGKDEDYVDWVSGLGK